MTGLWDYYQIIDYQSFSNTFTDEAVLNINQPNSSVTNESVFCP